MITTLLTVAYYGLVYLAWAMVVVSAVVFVLAFVKYVLWPNTTNYEDANELFDWNRIE